MCSINLSVRLSTVIHSLRFFYTASSGLSSFPEYVSAGMVDEVQFVHYDSVSKRAVPKQAWMDQLTRDRPDYWDWETDRELRNQQVFKVDVENAKNGQSGLARPIWPLGRGVLLRYGPPRYRC
uniref:MHC class I-like antigen recognition-like domain-containing protein n=1 Tax=Gadus morhua TaxID=8049 RepID=A0A8C4ZST0_GADMO